MVQVFGIWTKMIGWGRCRGFEAGTVSRLLTAWAKIGRLQHKGDGFVAKEATLPLVAESVRIRTSGTDARHLT